MASLPASANSASSACTSAGLRKMAFRPRCSSSGKENSGRFLAMEDLLRHLLVGLRPIKIGVQLDDRSGVPGSLEESHRLADRRVEQLDPLGLREAREV